MEEESDNDILRREIEKEKSEYEQKLIDRLHNDSERKYRLENSDLFCGKIHFTSKLIYLIMMAVLTSVILPFAMTMYIVHYENDMVTQTMIGLISFVLGIWVPSPYLSNSIKRNE